MPDNNSIICSFCGWEVEKGREFTFRGKSNLGNDDQEYHADFCNLCYQSYVQSMFQGGIVLSFDDTLIVKLIIRCTHMILKAIANIDKGKE